MNTGRISVFFFQDFFVRNNSYLYRSIFFFSFLLFTKQIRKSKNLKLRNKFFYKKTEVVIQCSDRRYIN